MNYKKYLLVFIISLLLCICPIYAQEVNNTNIDDVMELSDSQSGEINITDETYKNYFDVYSGEILSDADINDGDVLKIGNVNKKVFVIDRQLEITTINSGDVIKNGYLKLVNGSDNSVIHGLTIDNDNLYNMVDGIQSTYLSGIGLFYTNNNTLYNNSVNLAVGQFVFALPMGSSSNNKIYNNSFISTISTCVPMAGCHNNLFYNNYFQSTYANVIYYNPWGHAGYSGSPICLNNTFINNTMHALLNGEEWICGMVLRSDCNVKIINNTIYGVYNAIQGAGINSTVIGNRIYNTTGYAISAYQNVIVENNTISNSNLAIGILDNDLKVTNNIILNSLRGVWIGGSNVELSNNTIDITDSYWAVNIEGENATINNNIRGLERCQLLFPILKKKYYSSINFKHHTA